MARGAGGPSLPQLFRHRRIFGNSNASSENFQTSTVCKDKCFEIYQKIVEPTLLYRYHNASAGWKRIF